MCWFSSEETILHRLWWEQCVVSLSYTASLGYVFMYVCTRVHRSVCLCWGFSYSCLSLCSICRCRLSALLAKSNLKRLVPSSAKVRCFSASCNLHHYNQGQTQDHGEKKSGGAGGGGWWVKMKEGWLKWRMHWYNTKECNQGWDLNCGGW